MENPQNILIQFLAWVTDITVPDYGRQYLTDILQPSLQLEASIRKSFLRGDSPRASISDPHLGLFNAFILPSALRVVHAREENSPIAIPALPVSMPTCCSTCDGDMTNGRFSYYSETAHAICSFSEHQMFPLRSTMYRQTGTPCMVDNLAAFRENLRIFTHGALAEITNWNNMVIIGGSVVASLCGLPQRATGEWTPVEINEFYQSDKYYRKSDVDIFLYGLSPNQAIGKAEEIYSAIAKSALWPLTVIRKADRVSIHGLYPCRPIHIHLALYSSPAEIVANCDIDCACCVYTGDTVYMNPRALVALMCQTNILDLSRWSPSYEVRLAKYAERGFEVKVPFLQRNKVAYTRIYNRNLTTLPEGLARLLVLELLRDMPDHLRALDLNAVKRVTPLSLPNPSLSAPIDKLLANDDDVLWSQVPYGPLWDNNSLHALVDSINKELNRGENSARGRRLHRHPIFSCAELRKCFPGVCNSCPVAKTKVEKQLVRDEQGVYCRGTLTFYLMGSRIEKTKDHSLTLGESESERRARFTAEAYLRDGEAHEEDIFEPLARRFWHNRVLANDKQHKVERYTEVEGAAPAVVSTFQLYADIDAFMKSVIHERLTRELVGAMECSSSGHHHHHSARAEHQGDDDAGMTGIQDSDSDSDV